MTVKETPHKITAILKVTATIEFYDDEASEEAVRYTIEHDLEDAGFDVDVALLKKQEPVAPQKHYNKNADLLYACGKCRNDLKPNNRNARFCWFCGQVVKWDG